jgi:hypothetical protein
MVVQKAVIQVVEMDQVEMALLEKLHEHEIIYPYGIF